MSSNNDDDDDNVNLEPSAKQQIALPASKANVSSYSGEGEAAQPSQGGVDSPPKPAIRQRAQHSAQAQTVIRSTSASGGIITEQRYERQYTDDQSLLRLATDRPQSAAAAAGGASSYATQHTTTQTSVSSGHQVVVASRSRQTVDSSARFSLSSNTGGTISTSTTSGSVTQYAASQLSSSSSSSATTKTTQRSVVTSSSRVAHQVSSSVSTRLSSSGSISGETISTEAAAKALLLEQQAAGLSVQQLTGATQTITTTTQRASSTRAIASSATVARFSASSNASAIDGSIPFSQQLSGTSFLESHLAKSHTTTTTTTSSAASTISGQRSITCSSNNSTSASRSLLTSPNSSLLGAYDDREVASSLADQVVSVQSSNNEDHQLTAAPVTQITVITQELADTNRYARKRVNTAGLVTGNRTITSDETEKFLPAPAARSSIVTSTPPPPTVTAAVAANRDRLFGAKKENIASTTSNQVSTTDAVWTTSAAERVIASKYLDKSFRSTSPLVGLNLLESSSGQQSVEAKTHSATTSVPEKRDRGVKEGASTFRKSAEMTPSAVVGPYDPNQKTSDLNKGPLDVSGEAPSRVQVTVSNKPLDLSESGDSLKDTSHMIDTSPISESIDKELRDLTRAASRELSLEDKASDNKATIGREDSSQKLVSGQEGDRLIDRRLEEQIGMETNEIKLVNINNNSSNAQRSRKSSKENLTSGSSTRGSKSSLIGATRLSSSKNQDQSDLPIVSATTPNVNYSAISTNAKNSTFLPLPSELGLQSNHQNVQRSYPKKVFFIIVNEFCERFSYYGLRTILVLYLKGALKFSDADATVAFHLFAALCYITPILGAILADSIWGKFKTILYLSIVYFFGESILVLASVFWNTGGFAVGATILGLILIGIGAGGIKPCVCALGGDQFYPHETRWRQTFFSVFYGSINVGALLTMFITPLLRRNFQCVNRTDCFPYAFGLPTILMFIAIIVFVAAKKRYYIVPVPERNVIVDFVQCIGLSLRRKVSGYKLAPEVGESKNEEASNLNEGQRNNSDLDTSSSNLSISSNEATPVTKLSTSSPAKKQYLPDEQLSAKKILSTHQQQQQSNKKTTSSSKIQTSVVGRNQSTDRNHWLYLASDRFETKSIEDFRSVLSTFFLILPMPIYWTLYDQQGSLWTLQATRMDGRVFGTNYIIEPDQVGVLSPLLLLAAIPLFEIVIYPLLSRCNILTTSIQRITAGGLLMALAFIASAFIELRMQQFLPPLSPQPGQANLLLVNGLSDCSLSNPVISYLPQLINPENEFETHPNSTLSIHPHSLMPHLKPLNSKSFMVLSASNQSSPILKYQIAFQLTNFHMSTNESHITTNETSISQPPSVGCPFSQDMDHELSIAPLKDGAVKLLYLEQGNGKLTHRIFDDSLHLPPSGKARVRLLYEFFGSATLAHTHQFYLFRPSLNENIKFHTTNRDGQVLVSHYMDLDVKSSGELLFLRTLDKLLGSNSTEHQILLKPGTRNLIMVHQNNATDLNVKHQLLQDNDYQISIFYQLIPYTIVSMSEVLFSVTCLDFIYSIGPKNMKTILLAANSSTDAFGNLLTVLLASLHLFSNLAADYFFYAFIMVIDMAIFALMGYYFKPRTVED